MIQISAKRSQLSLLLHSACQMAQDQVLAHIIDQLTGAAACFFKNPVRKTSKTQNIHIHDAAGRGSQYKVLLRLHRILLRNDIQILRIVFSQVPKRFLCSL